jgi:hypothetical protein
LLAAFATNLTQFTESDFGISCVDEHKWRMLASTKWCLAQQLCAKRRDGLTGLRAQPAKHAVNTPQLAGIFPNLIKD